MIKIKKKNSHQTVSCWTHIAAIKSQLEEIRRAVSNHVPKAVIIQTKVLLRKNTDDSQSDKQNIKYKQYSLWTSGH